MHVRHRHCRQPEAKLDATLLWIKAQEDAGLTVISDGEQSRQHFVHGFLEQVGAALELAARAGRTCSEVADTIGRALQFVPRERLIACTNCGLAPMSRAVAEANLAALAKGAALADARLFAG